MAEDPPAVTIVAVVIRRGAHPRRTPVYGGVLIVAMMVAATALTYVGSAIPTAIRVVGYMLMGAGALLGVLLTLRDDS